jgi:hypothetical protein
LDIDVEYGDAFYHTEVQWLSGTVLKRVVTLGREMEMFMNEKGKIVALEMINFLAQNFKIIFNYFRNHATNIHIFQNQLSF